MEVIHVSYTQTGDLKLKVDKAVRRKVYKRKNRVTSDLLGVYLFRWQKEEMKLNSEA